MEMSIKEHSTIEMWGLVTEELRLVKKHRRKIRKREKKRGKKEDEGRHPLINRADRKHSSLHLFEVFANCHLSLRPAQLDSKMRFRIADE